VRKVLDETTATQAGYWKKVGGLWDGAEAPGRKTITDRKNEILVLPKAERQRWREALRGLDDKWVKDVEAKGVPGAALLKEARALAAKYGEAD
jgi:hypothetical protein